jgi:plasmid maintenance system killer protein
MTTKEALKILDDLDWNEDLSEEDRVTVRKLIEHTKTREGKTDYLDNVCIAAEVVKKLTEINKPKKKKWWQFKKKQEKKTHKNPVDCETDEKDWTEFKQNKGNHKHYTNPDDFFNDYNKKAKQQWGWKDDEFEPKGTKRHGGWSFGGHYGDTKSSGQTETDKKRKLCWDVLGIQKTENEEIIKKAFRELAKEHHPDKGGDEEYFKKINQAYEMCMKWANTKI